VDGLDGRLLGGKHVLGRFEQSLAGRREAHRARRALEERGVELCFERSDRPTQRRLGHAEAFGGATEMEFFGDGDEGSDLLQLHWRSPVSGGLAFGQRSLLHDLVIMAEVFYRNRHLL
jgi:hypothetical protein